MDTSYNEVNASPSKKFFVDMLTRDIELKDAILDLLDNCVDGIHRSSKHPDAKTPFRNYFAKIIISSSGFSLEDNCGGIPLKIAVEQAFKLGRDGTEVQEELSQGTVGMYGIGMKRAIFKIGRVCKVLSKSVKDNKAFRVDISEEWMSSNTNWKLPIKFDGEQLSDIGTKIVITKLNSEIAKSFGHHDKEFITDLTTTISQFYAVIIKKGFSVSINGESIVPGDFRILSSTGSPGTGIQPYVVKATINDVEIDVVVGFRSRLKSLTELDAETEGTRTSEDAGITVICNDRVVLHNDKSILTGWGRSGVPKYHTQFIAIAGFVWFRSTNLSNLPFTTTKRGLNTDSRVYVFALDRMIDGIKKFVDFTNKWKGQEEESNRLFEQTKAEFPTDIVSKKAPEEFTKMSRLEPKDTALQYIPKLPIPDAKNRKARIVFARTKESVESLKAHFYPDIEASPSEIGAKCFDVCLEKVVRGESF